MQTCSVASNLESTMALENNVQRLFTNKQARKAIVAIRDKSYGVMEWCCSLFTSHRCTLTQTRVDNDLAVITSPCFDQVE